MKTAVFKTHEVGVLLRGEVGPIATWTREPGVARAVFYVLLILAGAGLFGASMGFWRGPLQSVYSGVKLPTVGMGSLYLFFWLVATWLGMRFLHKGFQRVKSGGVLSVWIAIFVLVAMQMTTALSPIVGTAETFLPEKKEFFIAHWLDCMGASNAVRPTR